MGDRGPKGPRGPTIDLVRGDNGPQGVPLTQVEIDSIVDAEIRWQRWLSFKWWAKEIALVLACFVVAAAMGFTYMGQVISHTR